MSSIRIFGHYLPTRLLLLAAVELAILTTAAVVGLRMDAADPTPDLLPRVLVMVAVILFSMGAMGLYQPGLRAPGSGILLRLAASFVFGALALSIVWPLFPALAAGPFSLGVAGGAAFLGVAAAHLLFFRLTGEPWRRRVLVLGAGERARPMAQFRRAADRRNFEIVGFLALDNEPLCADLNGRQLLTGSLADLIARLRVDEVVVAADDRRGRLPMAELLKVRFAGVEVVEVTSFVEREAGKLRLDTLQPGWLVFGDLARPGRLYAAGKRLLDLTGALALLALLWPLMLLTAIAIRLDDGAPVLFRQVRVGLNGVPYRLVKFRSMRVDAERGGARWADANDDRVTRVGAIIRKVRIDELPQLYNVLKGEMSLVGPRPERPEFVAQLAERIPFFHERHQVKPGITGWAQLLYPYGASEQDAREKLQYDLYYVKNRSLFLDLLVLLQTVEVVLFGKGAR